MSTTDINPDLTPEADAERQGARYEAARKRLDSALTIDVSDTAVLFGQGQHTIRQAVRNGEIESVRLGRSIRILTAPLRAKLGLH